MPSPPVGFIKEENKADLHTISVVASNVTLPQIQLPKIATLEEPGYESRTGSLTDLSGRRNSVNIGALCEDVPNTAGPHIARPVTINNLIPPSLPRLNTYQLRPQLPDTHLNCHFNSNPYTTASHAPFESSYTTASTFTSQPAAHIFPQIVPQLREKIVPQLTFLQRKDVEFPFLFQSRFLTKAKDITMMAS